MSNKYTSVYDWLKYIKANVVGINLRELRVIWIKKNKKVEKRNLLLTYAEWRGKITFVAGKYINKQWQKLEKLVAVRQGWIVTKYFKKI